MKRQRTIAHLGHNRGLGAGAIAMVAVLAACGGPSETPEAESSPIEASGGEWVPSRGDAEDLAATQAFMATRPEVERPISVTGFETVPGVASMSVQACEGCHPQIAAEWRQSIHAQAWIDPQFQAEIAKSDNRWLCVNCHTPLLTQQDRWPVGIVDDDVERPRWVRNGQFDAALRDEGLNCAGCHVREDGIHGPGLENSQAPHAVVVDETYRSDAAEPMCLACHQAEQTYEGKPFVCTFQTGDEWRAGPYAAVGQACSHCHQPKVQRPAAVGGPVRTVGRHWFKGSGIPKFADRPGAVDALPGPGLEVSAQLVTGGLKITAVNANAGHWLPSGDPERWVQVDVTFRDATDGALGTETQRFGQTWNWTIPPVKVADNRLKPREARSWTLLVPPGAVVAELVASTHRISKGNAEYHGLGDYPRSIETHRSRVALTSGNGTD